MGERWKGLSRREDLRGVHDLLGSFRWFDAFCIDQGDDFERNHQVGLMRRIYSAASEVFVYLGELSSLSNEGFERLK